MPLFRKEIDSPAKTLQDLLYERTALMDRELLLPRELRNSDEAWRIKLGIENINSELKKTRGPYPMRKVRYVIFPDTRFERVIFSRRAR